MNVREIIAQTLYELETGSRKSHLLIRDVLDKYDYLDSKDKAFFKRVTEGTLARRLTLDYVADKYSKKPMNKCKPMIRVIIRMSIYQLMFMDKVPNHSVIDEAVKLTKKLSRSEFTGFVNALLRNVAGNLPGLEKEIETLPESLRLSVKYSMPEWLVKMFLKEQKNAESLIASLNEIRPTCVTIKDLSKKDDILSAWDEDDVKYEVSSYFDNTFLVSGFEGAYMLEGFDSGDLIIRDESSMLAAMAAGVKPGDDIVVIDVCAAPGGKTTTIAATLQGSGKVYSRDLTEDKVSMIKENIERLGLLNVYPQVFDATVFDPDMEGKADVVICDLPCSGLGVMGRKSDIRYNISNEIMRDLCILQREILSVAQRYVKPGGILIYSTCTIHKAENEKQVKYILDNFDFEGDSIKDILPELFKEGKERECDYMVCLRPDVDNTDGFFVSRFRKKK